MVRIAIVEDDRAYAKKLQGYLEQYRAEHQAALHCRVFHDGLAFLEGYHSDFDILLMDIEMPMLDGMSAARRVREADPHVVIMFITSMAQYAIRGYEVGALDFILKPVSYAVFSQKLQKAVRLANRNRQEHLLLPMNGTQRRVSIPLILYVEVAGHQLQIHTETGIYCVSLPLKKLEAELAGHPFAKCNQCYLVNLRQVEEFRGNTVVVGGHTLQVSRPRRKDFQIALTNYYGGI